MIYIIYIFFFNFRMFLLLWKFFRPSLLPVSMTLITQESLISIWSIQVRRLILFFWMKIMKLYLGCSLNFLFRSRDSIELTYLLLVCYVVCNSTIAWNQLLFWKLTSSILVLANVFILDRVLNTVHVQESSWSQLPRRA